MTEASWDEVGQRFAELGRELQNVWQKGQPDEAAKAELQDAGDKVRAALDDVAATINRTAGDPEVHVAAKRATTGVAEALASSLHHLAQWIEQRPPGGNPPPAGEPPQSSDS